MRVGNRRRFVFLDNLPRGPLKHSPASGENAFSGIQAGSLRRLPFDENHHAIGEDAGKPRHCEGDAQSPEL